MKRPTSTACALCRRQTPLTFHHLIPRKMHRRTFFKKTFTKETLQQGIMICRLCHNGIHVLFDEMILAKEFSTLEALKEDERLGKHIAWAAKQRI